MTMKRLSLVIALLIGGTSVLGPRAFADQPSEYEIKAAFLYNFAKFVTWPASSFAEENSPILIGILGVDPFGPILDETVRDKAIEGRPLVVKRIRDMGEAKGVHLLFIGQRDEGLLEKEIGGLDRPGILTVGDATDFAARYGVIGFFMEENRVRFEVNVGAAETAGLKISSRLLQLARVIGDKQADQR